MKVIFLICLFVMSTTVSAGFKKGNGGNAIVCGEKAELLDFFESKIIYGYEIHEDKKDWKDILSEKIADLSPYNAEVAASFSHWLSSFDQDALFLNDVDLGVINDSLHVVIPEGCAAKQTINQQFNPLPVEKRYWISKKIWDKFSSLDKAGIIFHEFAYRHIKAEDSRDIRQVTGFIFSNNFKTLSPKEVDQMLSDLGL